MGEGDIVTSSPPRNTFPLNEAARQRLFIAGGIGITPILSTMHRTNRIRAEFVLHYCTRDAARTAFHDELVSKYPDRVTFYPDGGNPARGLDLNRLLALRPAGADLFVCGPRGMIAAVRQAARSWPEGSVHYELFSSGRPSPSVLSTGENQSFVVELSRSGLTFTIPAEKSMLSVLLEHGFNVPSV